VEVCYNDWGRAPNFLNVDYYNVGSGSVFDVAAMYNNVTYDKRCCGYVTSGAETVKEMARIGAVIAAVVLEGWLVL